MTREIVTVRYKGSFTFRLYRYTERVLSLLFELCSHHFIRIRLYGFVKQFNK
jgi:hypothetical protein